MTRSLPTGLAAAAAASAGGGLVHAAATGTHNGDSTLATLFALTAAAQLAVAVLVVAQPRRRSVAALVGVSWAAFAAWGLSRTTGLPWPSSLREAEEVGRQDGVAAVLALVALVLGAVALRRPVRLTAARPALTFVAGLAALTLAVPGMTASHAHGGDGHDDGGHHHDAEVAVAAADDAEQHDHAHDDEGGDETSTSTTANADDGHHHGADGASASAPATTATTAHADDGHAATAHAHPPSTAAVAVPVASAPVPTVPATGDHGHGDHHDTTTTAPAAPVGQTTTTMPSGPIISIDDPRLTAVQQAAAKDLFDRTAAAMAQLTDEASVLAAGYVSIGDGGSGFEHFVNWSFLADAHELVPSKVESIVMRVQGGAKTVASAMYILSLGDGMDDVPDIAGELTTWHDHQNLCWEGTRLVGTTRADGSCPRGVFRPTPPMLHVWTGMDHPCGPFAGIEGRHGHGCGSHGH